MAIMTVVGVSRVRWIFLDVHGVCCRWPGAVRSQSLPHAPGI